MSDIHLRIANLGRMGFVCGIVDPKASSTTRTEDVTCRGCLDRFRALLGSSSSAVHFRKIDRTSPDADADADADAVTWCGSNSGSISATDLASQVTCLACLRSRVLAVAALRVEAVLCPDPLAEIVRCIHTLADTKPEMLTLVKVLVDRELNRGEP